MTVVRAIARDVGMGVKVADTSEDLAEINSPECAAVIWNRQLTPSFQSWLDACAPAQLPQGRIAVRPETAHEAINQLCDIAQTPQCLERAQLIDDVAHLATIFADVMLSKHLRLRLDVVRTNACRKFHVDAITARLICTYRGTGTQYGISQDGTDPTRISTVPTGAPVVLRGSLWPEKSRSGLLHRSPPIEGTEETRLLLVLDPISDPEDAR